MTHELWESVRWKTILFIYYESTKRKPKTKYMWVSVLLLWKRLKCPNFNIFFPHLSVRTFGRNFCSWPEVGEDASLRTSAYSCAALVLTLSPDACRRVVMAVAVRPFVFGSACGGKKFVAIFLRISITYIFICIFFIGVCTKETENESEMMWYRERVRHRERLFMRVHICTFPGAFLHVIWAAWIWHFKTPTFTHVKVAVHVLTVKKNAITQSVTDSVLFAFTSWTRDCV